MVLSATERKSWRWCKQCRKEARDNSRNGIVIREVGNTRLGNRRQAERPRLRIQLRRRAQ
jgi:hypothetical protein